VKHLRGTGRGDQIIQIVVKTPPHLTERQRELLREFADLSEQESKTPNRKKKFRLFSEKKE
jgi:molecular chaperone DnaJ